MPPTLIEFWRKKQGDIIAIGSIALFFIAFFGWTLFSRKYVIAGDSLFYTYPLRTLAWRMLTSGELPLWTPGVFSGYPLLSMAQLGLGYPLTWVYLIFPSYIAEKMLILAPFLLAPLFTYFYLRTLGRSVLASLLGALTFGYGGLMASGLATNGLLPNSVMWLPLLLIVIERSRRYRYIPCLIAVTCIYSFSVLTGLAQGFIIVGVVAGAYSIWLSVFAPVTNGGVLRGLDRWRPLTVTVSSALLSIGVAAFQIFESVRVVPLSVRSSLTYESFTQGSYTLTHLWQSFITPIFYAQDTHTAVPLLAVALSLIALLVRFHLGDPQRDTRVFFWGAVAVIAITLMLGINTPFYKILYYIPILNLFRVPSRHTIEWTFAVAVLSSYGWDALRSVLRTRLNISSHRNVASTFVSIGLTVLGLFVGYKWWVLGQNLGKDATCLADVTTIYQFWKSSFVTVLLAVVWQAALVKSQRLRTGLLGAAILITCFVEPSLLVHRWWSDFAMPSSRFTQPSAITRFLKQFPATENRLYTRTALMADQDQRPRFDAPNVSAMWGLHEVAGYEPLILQRYSRALGGAWLDGVLPRDSNAPDATLVSDRSHVLDLLNTRFMVTFANLSPVLVAGNPPNSSDSLLRVSNNWKPVFEERGAFLWRNSRALPRAWLVVDARAVDAETSLRTIRGESSELFDPRQTALLEVSQSELPNLPGGPLPPNSSVRVTKYESNRLTLETDAPTNTVLVVSEIFYPGWEVSVDGKQDRILTADYLLRGVALPPGQHTVEMRYSAPAARIGAIISLATLGLLSLLGFYSRRFWFVAAENRAGIRPHAFIRTDNKIFSWLRHHVSLSRWLRPGTDDLEGRELVRDVDSFPAILGLQGTWWSIGFIVLFFLIFFGRIFISNRFLITGDAFYYSYPLRTVAWEMIREGQFPLWTPLFLSGYPLLAVAQLGLGYPLTWFHLIVPGHIAEQIYVLAPFIITPVTTYAYLRQLHRSHLASIFGALAFAYGGMMCGIIANSGMLTNGFTWAPLVLIFVDRARSRSFAYCVFWMTLSYGLAVLAGHAQSYVYVGLLGLAYAAFTSVSIAFTRKQGWATLSTWRPLLATISAIALAAGLAAFQLLEVMRAARRSIRSALTYQLFSEGSFTLREAVLSLGAPIYHYVDSGTYLTPIAFVTAFIAVIAFSKRWIKDERVWFWIAVAAVSWLLLLGSSTPLNTLIYYVPILNSFRVPSRHTFEWTLAVSVLAAYGWDHVELVFRAKRSRTRTSANDYKSIGSIVLIALSIGVGILFWRALVQIPESNTSTYTGLPEELYWRWKALFTVFVFAAAVLSFQIGRHRLRVACLLVVIGLACLFEANATTNCWWAGLLSLPAERFHVVSDSTRYLQQFPAEQNRIYTRVGLFAEEFTTEPRLEAPNLTMLSHLQNVAGMEPVMLQRYSRAFGDIGPDFVTRRSAVPVKNDLFQSGSHVLDILNTTHVVTFTGSLGIYEELTTNHEGVHISVGDFDVSLRPGEKTDFVARQQLADELVLVSALSNSAGEPNNTPVARVRFFTREGHIIERDILAGVHTAEWAHERPDVRKTIKHSLATVFDSKPGDQQNTFPSHRYWGRIKIDSSSQVDRVEVINTSQTATITISKLSLVNSHDSQSSPLWIAPSSAWTTVFEDRGVEVLKNSRALPRAWLVAQAQAVDGEKALKAIRGESVEQFDPRESVLLEVKPEELPKLPGGRIDPSSDARVVEYRPTKLTIETNAPTNTVLVVSEIFYPGWEATLDGQKVRINLANYLLRAVAVPAGRHRIEMRYEAPAARNGALISISTLILLFVLFLRSRRAPYAAN